MPFDWLPDPESPDENNTNGSDAADNSTVWDAGNGLSVLKRGAPNFKVFFSERARSEGRGCLEEGCLGLPGVFPDSLLNCDFP